MLLLNLMSKELQACTISKSIIRNYPCVTIKIANMAVKKTAKDCKIKPRERTLFVTPDPETPEQEARRGIINSDRFYRDWSPSDSSIEKLFDDMKREQEQLAAKTTPTPSVQYHPYHDEVRIIEHAPQMGISRSSSSTVDEIDDSPSPKRIVSLSISPELQSRSNFRHNRSVASGITVSKLATINWNTTKSCLRKSCKKVAMMLVMMVIPSTVMIILLVQIN